jgi:hypothetical protein
MLRSPKATRAALIGAAAGTGGAGKTAIYNVLVRFAREYLTMDHWQQSDTLCGGDLGEVHLLFTAALAKEHRRELAVLSRYAALLGGEPEQVPAGAVIKGPWLRAAEAGDAVRNYSDG